MDGGGIGRHQGVEFAKDEHNRAAVEVDRDLAFIRIDIGDGADIAVIDLLVIVVLDLHDLVARRKGPAEALDLLVAGRSQDNGELGLLFRRSGSGATSARSGDGHGSRGGHAPLLFQELGELSGLENGEGREVVDDLLQVSH